MNQLLTILNVKDDEQKAIKLLLAHSFFIGIFLAFFFSYASGAFLGEFGTKTLPYAYIATGFTGYLASAIFGSLQQRISYPKLLVGTLFMLLALMILFFVGLQFINAPWLIFVIYIFIIPFYTMVALQYWGMVMKLFDLRQGKRLFGLIGSGDVVSSLIGFSAVPFILGATNGDTSFLLLLGIIGLAIGIVLQFSIIKQFSAQLEGKKSSGNAKKHKGSLNEVFSNKYFVLIFILTICSVFGQNFVDYNFMGLARSNFKKEELTAFFGIFFAIIKVVELISKTALAGRLLNQYGLRFGLVILPILLLVFSVLAALVGTFSSEMALLFIPLAMNKLFDRAVRKSLDEPSVKVLYQPLDMETKIMVQTQAEGKAKQIAIIASGVLLILFNYLELGLVATIYFLCIVLIVWVFVSGKMYIGYRKTIQQKLSDVEEGEQHEQQYVSIRYIAHQLKYAQSEEQIEIGLKLAELVEPSAIAPLLPEFLLSDSASIRMLAARIIERHQLLNLVEDVRNAVERERLAEVKDVLLNTEIELSQIKQLTEEQIGLLARDPEPASRKVAASWLAYHEHPKRLLLLRELASDKNNEVAVSAVRSSAAVKSEELWSLLIDFMHIPTLSNVAVPALVAEGEDVIEVLEFAFERFEKYPLIQLKIVQICGRVTGERAMGFLYQKLFYPEREVQITAAYLLAGMQFVAADWDIPQIKDRIKKEVNYATWLIVGIIELRSNTQIQERLLDSLRAELKLVTGYVFQLLGLLYESEAIARVEANLQKGTKDSVALAMEMIDILLDDELKESVAPLIDQLPLAEKRVKLEAIYPQKHCKKVVHRLREIIYYDFSRLNRWIKACAIHQLIYFSSKEYDEIEALVFHSDFFVKETALVALHHSNPEKYDFYTSAERRKNKIKYDRVTGFNRKLSRIPSNFEEVAMMKQNQFLNQLPESLLVKLSELAEQESLEEGVEPDFHYLKGNFVHFIVEGSFELVSSTEKYRYQQGDAIGLLEDVVIEDYELRIIEPAKVFYLEKASFYAIAQVHLPLTEAIFSSLVMAEEGTVEENTVNVGTFEQLRHSRV